MRGPYSHSHRGDSFLRAGAVHESDDITVAPVFAAAQRLDVIAAVDALYRDLDAEIAAHTPACWNKGECCRFGEYGHRLYVTTLEAAYYVAMHVSRPEPPAIPSAMSLPVLESRTSPSGDVCPHAHGGRCHVRPARPIGCRIFYCDPAAQHWQGPMTETHLARLRALHERLGVPYFYADWMKVLAALERSENVRK